MIVAGLLSCKKKEEVATPTIFEGFENKEFYDVRYPEIVNNTWTTFDNYHSLQNRLYFRGDGTLFVKFNYPSNSSYTENGSFDLTGTSLMAEKYGHYYIDTIYLNITPVTMVLIKAGTTDTVSFYRDKYIVR